MIPQKIIELVSNYDNYRDRYYSVRQIWGDYTLSEKDTMNIINLIVKNHLPTEVIGDVFGTQPITQKVLDYCKKRFQGAYKCDWDRFLDNLEGNYRAPISKQSIENKIKIIYGGIFEKNNERGFYAFMSNYESTLRGAYVKENYSFAEYSLYDLKYVRDIIDYRSHALRMTFIPLSWLSRIDLEDKRIGTIKLARIDLKYDPEKYTEYEEVTLWRRLK